MLRVPSIARAILPSSIFLVSCLVDTVVADASNLSSTPAFVENVGQWPEDVLYCARGGGGAIWFTRDEVVLDRFEANEANEVGVDRGLVVRARFMNAESPAIEGSDPLPGQFNFFTSADPGKWRSGIKSYSKLRYRNLYDGVDLLYSWSGPSLKYDLVLAPWKDIADVQVAYNGCTKIAVEADGRLRLETECGTLHEGKPEIYQMRNGRRLPVSGSYVIRPNHIVGFELGAYDPSLPVIVDPHITWSTFIGGSSLDIGQHVTLDPSGKPVVVGATLSPDFPTTAGAYDRTGNGGLDVYVMKLGTHGGNLAFATFLGGAGFDGAQASVVDGSGNIVVAGSTAGSGFPTTVGAYDRTYNGGIYDVFVAKLSPQGDALIFSTLLGGSDYEVAGGVGLDGSGNVVVGGFTGSSNFPATAGAYDTVLNGYDAFFAKVSGTGGSLVYSTFFGGEFDEYLTGVAMDASGSMYAIGMTSSDDLPGAIYDASLDGAQDAFVAKFDFVANKLSYSSYLGGSGWEDGYAIAVDSKGRAVCGGFTQSNDYPVTPDAYDSQFEWPEDGFITRMTSDGFGLSYSTYIGGTGFDEIYGVTLDSEERIVATGATSSSDFPMASYILGSSSYGGGDADAFICHLSLNGTELVGSGLLGGAGRDLYYSVAVGPRQDAFLAGYSESVDFPTTAGAYDVSQNGGADVIVGKVALVNAGVAKAEIANTVVQGGAPELYVDSPTKSDVRGRVSTASPAQATLTLFDCGGRRVATESLTLGPGATTFELRRNGLSAGIYYLRLDVEGRRLSRKVVVVR